MQQVNESSSPQPTLYESIQSLQKDGLKNLDQEERETVMIALKALSQNGTCDDATTTRTAQIIQRAKITTPPKQPHFLHFAEKCIKGLQNFFHIRISSEQILSKLSEVEKKVTGFEKEIQSKQEYIKQIDEWLTHSKDNKGVYSQVGEHYKEIVGLASVLDYREIIPILKKQVEKLEENEEIQKSEKLLLLNLLKRMADQEIQHYSSLEVTKEGILSALKNMIEQLENPKVKNFKDAEKIIQPFREAYAILHANTENTDAIKTWLENQRSSLTKEIEELKKQQEKFVSAQPNIKT